MFPETVSRDGSGDTIVRAIHLTSPLRLDGQLDEAVYRELRPASDFIQEDPDEGAPHRSDRDRFHKQQQSRGAAETTRQ